MQVSLKFLLVLFLSLTLLTTGCVYLRLLQVKRQLSAFNSYFQIEEQDKLTLVFLKPVLLAKDVTWLMNSPPMSRKETEEGHLWEYVMEKQYRDSDYEESDFNIPISMVFVDDKLRQISFPERFLRYLSKPLLARMLTSMGEAEIDKARRRAGSRFQARGTVEIPREEQVLDVLGKPYSTEESDDTKRLIYAYDLKKDNPEPVSNGFSLIMTFKFKKEDDKLRKTEINLRGLKMSLDFSLDQGEGS
jgi:hypothetical protein